VFVLLFNSHAGFQPHSNLHCHVHRAVTKITTPSKIIEFPVALAAPEADSPCLKLEGEVSIEEENIDESQIESPLEDAGADDSQIVPA
jgi:hypothetical protein